MTKEKLDLGKSFESMKIAPQYKELLKGLKFAKAALHDSSNDFKYPVAYGRLVGAVKMFLYVYGDISYMTMEKFLNESLQSTVEDADKL